MAGSPTRPCLHRPSRRAPEDRRHQHPNGTSAARGDPGSRTRSAGAASGAGRRRAAATGAGGRGVGREVQRPNRPNMIPPSAAARPRRARGDLRRAPDRVGLYRGRPSSDRSRERLGSQSAPIVFAELAARRAQTLALVALTVWRPLGAWPRSGLPGPRGGRGRRVAGARQTACSVRHRPRPSGRSLRSGRARDLVTRQVDLAGAVVTVGAATSKRAQRDPAPTTNPSAVRRLPRDGDRGFAWRGRALDTDPTHGEVVLGPDTATGARNVPGTH